VFLACTAFALDALFAMPGAVSLDPRSVVMVTGGFKGRAVRLDAPSLYAALAARLGAPRVVGEYRSRAGHNGATAGAEPLHICAGSLPRDPLALAGGHSRSTIEAHRHLADDSGPAPLHAGEKPRVQFCRFAGQDP
jgi:hypothetical protein